MLDEWFPPGDLLQHGAHVLPVHQAPALGHPHQLGAGRVGRLRPLYEVQDDLVQSARLLAELGVRERHVLALEVLEEEEHGLDVREQAPEVLGRRGGVLHDRL